MVVQPHLFPNQISGPTATWLQPLSKLQPLRQFLRRNPLLQDEAAFSVSDIVSSLSYEEGFSGFDRELFAAGWT